MSREFSETPILKDGVIQYGIGVRGDGNISLIANGVEVFSVTPDGVPELSSTTGITASTTQTQGEQPLTSRINEISVCATASDVVTMSPAAKGLKVVVINNGAETLQVFPATGDTIAGGAANASTTQTAGTSVTWLAFNDTDWVAV